MRRFVFLVALTALLPSLAGAAVGQDYRFRVPKLVMEVTVDPDASVRVVYDFTFRNEHGAHPIDVVDVGTFHAGYDLRKVTASCDGITLTDIRTSEFVKPGFEVHLGRATIASGGSATVHVEYTLPDMVYQDTTRKDYASLQVTPTWFGSQYILGTTDLNVVILLPKGIKPDEVLWQDVKFDQVAAGGDTVAVAWRRPSARLDHAERFSVSFPRRVMSNVVRMSKFDLLRKWFHESQNARIWVGIFVVAAWTFLYFRFTGGTGFSVYVILTALLIWLFVASPDAELLGVPVVAGLVFLNEWGLGRRRSRYMPPVAQVEGGGIKRGLTAPEAAVLLELPLSKVLTLVIFGMLKKGILRQIDAEPLRVAVNGPFAVDDKTMPATIPERAALYGKMAQQTGVAVHKYEPAFLYLIQRDPARPLSKIHFDVPMKQLIAQVAERMKGFDLSDTQDYYRSIIRRALAQAKSIGDVPMREKAIDRNFEWILMNDDYPTVFTGRPYWPTWCRPGHVMMGPGGAVAQAAGQAVDVGGKTSFGDVAASFAGWTEHTMGSMASAISPDGLSVAKPSGGFLNLTGADNLTGEILASLAEGSKEGGGGGGFSGCACAGCACACACAGGGR
ncbi:MAG TPA: hypothetical protein VJL29_06335 [Thermoguttaceae bacterium]|nr:hypothetical protein [Thermoguttaceae bacterium]